MTELLFYEQNNLIKYFNNDNIIFFGKAAKRYDNDWFHLFFTWITLILHITNNCIIYVVLFILKSSALYTIMILKNKPLNQSW